MGIDQLVAVTRDSLSIYDPANPMPAAEALRQVWRRAVPLEPPILKQGQKTLLRDWGIKDPAFEAVGTPVPILTAIGREIGRRAKGAVSRFLPLARLLWQSFGREGRIVAAVALGPMELAHPETVVPVLHELAQTCIFWEDCDQLAMKALEPVLRRDPVDWLDRIGLWVTDRNKWVCRAGLIALGRLPMVHPQYTHRCVELEIQALGDPDRDVKRALSFALRTNARGEVEPVKDAIRSQRYTGDRHTVWVLCDVIRSMTPKLLGHFTDLLPVYSGWLDLVEPAARRGVAGAIRVLRQAR